MKIPDFRESVGLLLMAVHNHQADIRKLSAIMKKEYAKLPAGVSDRAIKAAQTCLAKIEKLYHEGERMVTLLKKYDEETRAVSAALEHLNESLQDGSAGREDDDDLM